ncbi:MAG: hypothetical protein N3G21_10005 [Candidatus Hydrogenedentes bacterium]|nr:hypothetical protein [Candidatus Hydrogenedentota bacterium]
MKKYRKFLIVLILTYIVLFTIGIYLYRTPNFSNAHISKHETIHKLYIEVSKKSEYQKFKERPDKFSADLETLTLYRKVLDYENSPEFIREKRRIQLYLIWFRTLNTGTLLVASFVLGWKSLQNSLGKYQRKILTRKNTIEENYRKSLEELERAEVKHKELQKIIEKIESKKEQIISERLTKIEEQNKEALKQIDFLLNTSKKEAENECLNNLREIIIKESLKELEHKIVSTETPERLTESIEKFNFFIEMLS